MSDSGPNHSPHDSQRDATQEAPLHDEERSEVVRSRQHPDQSPSGTHQNLTQNAALDGEERDETSSIPECPEVVRSRQHPDQSPSGTHQNLTQNAALDGEERDETSSIPECPEVVRSRQHPDQSPSGTHQNLTQNAALDGEEHDETSSIPERLPDTFAEFMADGDVEIASTKSNFLTDFFKKATDTLESSLHHAQQTGSDALNTAHTAGSSAVSAVTGIVREIGNGLTEPSERQPRVFTGFAPTTHSIKSFQLPSTPILLLPPDHVVCRSSICHLPPSGRAMAQSMSSGLEHVQPFQAISAARMSESHLILGLETGALRVLSLAGTAPARVHESAVENSRATALCAGDNVVAVGTQHGYTTILNISDLSVVKTITPPNLCAVQLGAALQYATVSCLAVSRDDLLLIGYDDGAVKFSKMADNFVQIPFVAHSRRVSGVLLFYDVLAVTIGNATDPSLAIFDAYTGRCLARRILPYAPHSLGKSDFNLANEEGAVCPSEMNFMIGGAQGQVEVFRLLVLSPEKVEVQLVKTFSDRVRGKDHAVIQVAYVPDQALLLALSSNGELRRWRVSKEDGCELALLVEELSCKPVFTEENIVTAADQDFSLPDGSKLNSLSEVIKAQNILAEILENERILEVEKDRVVSEFQQCQAKMLVATSLGDTELRRARRRMVSRYDAGLRASNTSGTPTSVQLAKTTKRAAAFEIEFTTRRHAESRDRSQTSCVANLKSILRSFLKRLPFEVLSTLEQVKRDIDTLGQTDIKDS